MLRPIGAAVDGGIRAESSCSWRVAAPARRRFRCSRGFIHVFLATLLVTGCASAPAGTEGDSGTSLGPTTPEEFRQLLDREYRASGLMDQGIEGTTLVWIHVNAKGTVEDVRVGTGSGNEALDRLALHVARAHRFAPALNRGRPVPVWIQLPMTFKQR